MKSLATHLMFSLMALLVLSVSAVCAGSGGGGATSPAPASTQDPRVTEAQFVYSDTHNVTPNAPYAAQVPVEPAHTYLVQFAATADGSVMAGEVIMMQDADPQATVELAEYTAVPKDSGSFEFYAPSNPTGPQADLILSASQGSGSVHVTVQDITPEDLMIYDEAEDNSVFVHSATHHVTDSAPYITEVPVKPDYVYLVSFFCTANEWNGDPLTENLMVGQVAMVQDGVPQPTAEFAEYTAVPKASGGFEFYAHTNPIGPTADLILTVSQGGGKIQVLVEELGMALGEPLDIYSEANDHERKSVIEYRELPTKVEARSSSDSRSVSKRRP